VEYGGSTVHYFVGFDFDLFLVCESDILFSLEAAAMCVYCILCLCASARYVALKECVHVHNCVILIGKESL
jgi:hypothetical protein